MNIQARFSWGSIVDARLQAQVSEIVHEACLSFKTEELPTSPNPLADGYAGVALTCAQMDRCFPREGWGDLAKGYVLHALREIAQGGWPLKLGLFDGLTGIAWSAYYVADGDSGVQRILTRLDELLVGQIEAFTKLSESPDYPAKGGIPSQVYDIISGAAGMGLYLLERRNEPGIPAVLERVYDLLIWVVNHNHPGRKAFQEFGAREDVIFDWPKGVWDLGLAHGLPGVLTALAKGGMSGVRHPELRRTVHRLARWLISLSQHDDWGITWPAFLPPSSALRPDLPPARTAWCYGPPGVARALWLAAQFLQDAEIQQIAIQAMEACCRRPRNIWQATEPTFCHGLSGIAQVLLRFFHDTGIGKFAELANTLVRNICDEYTSNLKWGFPSPDRPEAIATGAAALQPKFHEDVSSPGLLQGAAGIILVLLATSQDVYPEWDKIFGLS